MKTMQQLKEENAIQDRIAKAIADIRTARLDELMTSYNDGYLTAAEFLQLTDNMLQEELKQAMGRA